MDDVRLFADTIARIQVANGIESNAVKQINERFFPSADNANRLGTDFNRKQQESEQRNRPPDCNLGKQDGANTEKGSNHVND